MEKKDSLWGHTGPEGSGGYQKLGKMGRWGLGLAVGLLCLFMANNYLSSNSQPVPARAALPITSEKLAAAYAANEVRADQLYHGKALLVSGKVARIAKGLLGAPYVILEASGPVDARCSFPRSASPFLARLRPGQDITAICTCQGKAIDVRLDGCSLGE